jgi:hypothetical protein
MTRTTRFLIAILTALLLLLAGCGKQEAPSPSPSPTPTPTPPPKVAGNPNCSPDGPQGQACKLTTGQIAAETGDDHTCAHFNPDNAIIVKMTGNPGNGKFKKIRVVQGNGHDDDFQISIEACPGATVKNPFPNAKNPHKNDWDSGELDPNVKPGWKYRLILTEYKKKGGAQESDPHIIIDAGP